MIRVSALVGFMSTHHRKHIKPTTAATTQHLSYYRRGRGKQKQRNLIQEVMRIVNNNNGGSTATDLYFSFASFPTPTQRSFVPFLIRFGEFSNKTFSSEADEKKINRRLKTENLFIHICRPFRKWASVWLWVGCKCRCFLVSLFF